MAATASAYRKDASDERRMAGGSLVVVVEVVMEVGVVVRMEA